MLNISALTKTLSAMSLPQLQQYASLHKNDPYVVTMALSIANQKKQMQTAAEGQAGQQPMPPVVDQEISQIAPRPAPMPETVGIGQLPVQNIAKMAGGGIVAFGEGGDVPRYQFGGVPSSGTQFDIPGMVSQGSFSPQPGAQDDQTWAQKKLAQLEAKVEAGTATPQERAWVRMFGKPKTAQPAVSAGMPDQTAAESSRLMAAGQSAVSGQTPSPAPGGEKSGAPGANAQPFAMPQVKIPGFKPSEPVPVPTADELRTRYSTLLGSDPYYDPLEARQTAINAQAAASKQKGIAALEKDIADQGIYGVEREKRIGERETKLTKDESINASMAILSAGLGTLAGTSPFFGANLGEGGKQGIAAYIKGKEKIDSARERLDDARDKLEDIRRNETTMNKREVRAAKADLENTLLQGQRELLAGTRQAYGQNSQLANTMLGIQANAEDTARKIASNEKIAQYDAQTRAAIANKPGEQMAMALALGGGDLKAGLTTFSQIQAEAQSGKWNPRDAYTQYLLGWNKNAQSNPIYAQENPMLNFTSFLAQFSIPTGGGNAPSSMAGKDRARPAG